MDSKVINTFNELEKQLSSKEEQFMKAIDETKNTKIKLEDSKQELSKKIESIKENEKKELSKVEQMENIKKSLSDLSSISMNFDELRNAIKKKTEEKINVVVSESISNITKLINNIDVPKVVEEKALEQFNVKNDEEVQKVVSVEEVNHEDMKKYDRQSQKKIDIDPERDLSDMKLFEFIKKYIPDINPKQYKSIMYANDVLEVKIKDIMDDINVIDYNELRDFIVNEDSIFTLAKIGSRKRGDSIFNAYNGLSYLMDGGKSTLGARRSNFHG